MHVIDQVRPVCDVPISALQAWLGGEHLRQRCLLLGQTRRTKIPAGVPSGVKVANKTGELAAVQNDVAIVFGTHPYVLAVMSSDISSAVAPSQITELSRAVWDAAQ